MCGIAGWIDPRMGNRAEAVRRMVGELAHRGPDDEGVYESASVTLGHRRLAIIDVDRRSQQPMTRGDHTIVFNGEIYNYLEIRRQLEDAGHQFSTTSDTEVLLAAYAEWGRDCTRHFDGMWAFALHDRQTGQVVLSRDPFGEKPLVYTLRGSGVVFASETSALKAGVGDLEPDPMSLIGFLSLGRLPDATAEWYSGVSTLAPGHDLVVDLATGSREVAVQASPEPTKLSVDAHNIGDTENAFESALIRSVTRRLRSDVPVGSLLSGGVDSGLLCAVAAPLYREMSGQPILALTASSGDARNDESGAARDVAVRSGAHWECVRVDPVMDHEYLLEATHTLQQPLRSLSICMQQEVYARAASLGLKVVLDGQGADETWLGYPRHRFQALRQGRLRTLPASLAHSIRNSGLSATQAAAMAIYFQFPSVPAARAVRSLNQIGVTTDFRATRRWYRESVASGSRTLEEAQNRELSDGQLQSLLTVADRNSMHRSLEVRLPYLGRELSALARDVAPWSLRQSGWSKYQLRMALDRRGLSSIAWNTRKIGFEAHRSSFDPRGAQVRHFVAKSELLSNLGVELASVPPRLMWRMYALALWEEACLVHVRA